MPPSRSSDLPRRSPNTDFDACYALNVKVPFFLVGAIAPAMAARGDGAIVNVSTMVSMFGTAGAAVYASSKAALNLLTKSWAAEYGPKGVRINAVAPGPTLTEGTTAQYGTDRLAALAAQAPARRVADPSEIARTIGFWLARAPVSSTARAACRRRAHLRSDSKAVPASNLIIRPLASASRFSSGVTEFGVHKCLAPLGFPHPAARCELGVDRSHLAVVHMVGKRSG